MSPVPVTRLSLEHYAAFRAELSKSDDENAVRAVRERYELDAVSEAEEVAAWGRRFLVDRFAFADYMQIFARLRGDAQPLRRLLRVAASSATARSPELPAFGATAPRSVYSG